MKSSWKFRLHMHNYTSTGQHVSVGQRNPLRQVMWVSNPLEGYRIPVSAVRCLSALSKTSTGPRAKACQATRQSDGEPTPRCTGPWPSPTHCHWGCTLGGLPSLQHNPDVHHSSWTCWGIWVHTHTHLVCDCANKGSMQMKIFPVCLSLGLWLLPFLQENPLKSINLDAQSQRIVLPCSLKKNSDCRSAAHNGIID